MSSNTIFAGYLRLPRPTAAYSAVHNIQQTEQIPNDPPRMEAKSTTTRNHPSTPSKLGIKLIINKTT